MADTRELLQRIAELKRYDNNGQNVRFRMVNVPVELFAEIDDVVAAPVPAPPAEPTVAEAHHRIVSGKGEPSDYRRVLGDPMQSVMGAPTAEPAPHADPTRNSLVAAMVDRFLAWPLPKDFAPDCGISFDGRGPDARGYDRGWPIGTNLFTAEQARAMFLHALAAPAAEAVAQPVDGDATKACISALRLVSELEAGRLPNDVFRAVDSALEMVDAPKVTHEPTRQYWCWKHGAYGEGSCPLCAAEPVAQPTMDDGPAREAGGAKRMDSAACGSPPGDATASGSIGDAKAAGRSGSSTLAHEPVAQQPPPRECYWPKCLCANTATCEHRAYHAQQPRNGYERSDC